MQKRDSRLGSRKEYALATLFCLVLSLEALRQGDADLFFVRRDYTEFISKHLWNALGAVGLMAYWASALWHRSRKIGIPRWGAILCVAMFTAWWGLVMLIPSHRGLLALLF